ncbi:MAG: SDR family oxidoreductase [Bryobacterales bacterium]
MRNVLVTGGAGFIGSSLVRGLVATEGVERIAVLDDLSSGKRENLAEVANRVELIEGDVRDRELLDRTVAGADTIFHLAAIASVPKTIEQPDAGHEVNLEATFRLLRSAVDHRARRVVFAASAAAYGNAPGLPKREDMTPDPQSPYAVQKLAGEMYLRTFFDCFGLETVSLRFFNVYGPRQDPSSPYSGVLSIFSDCLLARRAPTIFGTGEQSRDFIFVDDIVQALLLAARSPNAPGRLYNCGTGRRVSLLEVWEIMQRVEGVELPPRFGPARSGDVEHSEADISRARSELGFAPAVTIEEGLRRTLAWVRASRP